MEAKSSKDMSFARLLRNLWAMEEKQKDRCISWVPGDVKTEGTWLFTEEDGKQFKHPASGSGGLF